jgi:hypothetical protein
MNPINFTLNPTNRNLLEEREFYKSNPTELCLYGLKYGTDKTPILGHTYTPIYDKLFNTIRDKVNVLVELGLGDISGKVGASLKMWRDYFKNANVYGLDHNKLLLFSDERIKTLYTDQRMIEMLLSTKNELIKMNEKIISEGIDIFIDDGSHMYEDQMKTLCVFWDLIKPGGYFIIEDIYLKEFGNASMYSFEDYRSHTSISNIMKECDFSVYRSSNDNHLILYRKKQV